MLRKRPSKLEYMFESWGVFPNIGQELGAVMAVKIINVFKRHLNLISYLTLHKKTRMNLFQ